MNQLFINFKIRKKIKDSLKRFNELILHTGYILYKNYKLSMLYFEYVFLSVANSIYNKLQVKKLDKLNFKTIFVLKTKLFY